MDDHMRVGGGIVGLLAAAPRDSAQVVLGLKDIVNACAGSYTIASHTNWTDDEATTPAAALWHSAGWVLRENRMFSHDALVFEQSGTPK